MLGILNDLEITEAAMNGMIAPFVSESVRSDGINGIISYGLSSYGYDLRLSPLDFCIFHHQPGKVVDPKEFDPRFLEKAELQEDKNGQFFILPGNSYALGVTIERLKLPPDVTTLFIGKSTYARVGIIANLTPGEASWEGHLTLEFSNSSSADTRIYANEGIVQALFVRGRPCRVNYDDRRGKYQDQKHEVTLARV